MEYCLQNREEVMIYKIVKLPDYSTDNQHPLTSWFPVQLNAKHNISTFPGVSSAAVITIKTKESKGIERAVVKTSYFDSYVLNVQLNISA